MYGKKTIRNFRVLLLGLTPIILPQLGSASDFFVKAGALSAVQMSTNVKASLEVESRWDEHGDQVRHHSDLGVVYTRVAQWLDIGLNFRSVFREISADQWVKEQRYYLNLLARNRIANIGFNHRLRFEYNQWDSGFSDFATLRYRIGVNPPFELDSKREGVLLRAYKARPYVNYEVAVSSLNQSVSSQTGTFGFSFSFTERVYSNLYYEYQAARSEVSDSNSHFAGLTLKLLY